MKGTVYIIDLETVSIDRRFRGRSAVVEAVHRVIDYFGPSVTSAAVVGCKGRFGSQIVDVFHEAGVSVCGIDLGDDLCQVKNAEIVVSAVGKPHLISREHLSAANKLVIDVGFFVQMGTPTLYLGDVDPAAYGIPEFVMPVPGGIGPLQVATLVERIATIMIGEEAPRWSLSCGLAKHTL